jgi:hypothetical protein
MRHLWWVIVLAAVVLGAVLRLACLSAEFWLDEIWSWDLSRQAGSLAGVFFRLHHDNNHHLNTLWLLLCPAGAPWQVYRLHSLIAGLLAIIVAAKIAHRWGKADAAFAALLVAASYWLVLSSAEARGYSLAVCFALVALDCFWRYLESGSWLALVLFWLASIAGFLSHLTFVHAYLGFVAWSLRRRASLSEFKQIRHLIVEHGIPAAFMVHFYTICLRGMELGGGPPSSLWQVLGRLISIGLGGPGEGWSELPLVAGAVVIFLIGLWLLARQQGQLAVFFAIAIVGSPLLFMLRRPPRCGGGAAASRGCWRCSS